MENGAAEPASGAPPVAILGHHGVQSDTLEDLAQAVRYRSWLIDLAIPCLSSPVLEIGSGLGLYALDMAARGLEVTASEGDPERAKALRARFAEDPRVSARELPVPLESTDNFASLVSFNVLEHIEDDTAALRSFARLVRPGGDIVAIVPAFPVGMSAFDRSIGHVRRYRKATLRATVERAGLEVRQLRHVNAVGLVAWILLIRLAGGQPRQGRLLAIFDSLVVPVLERVERRLEPPFGQSILLHAKVPG